MRHSLQLFVSFKDAVQVHLHLRITCYDTQLCGRCLVNMTPVVKVVIHCVFALL